MHNQQKSGRLELICGPMFSGKSEELIRRVRRAQIAQQEVLIFKPSVDTRDGLETITSHNGRSIQATPIAQAEDIVSFCEQKPHAAVIGLDEVQFFEQNIINIVCTLVDKGKRVIIAGLDLDFRAVPFGPIPTLLAIADSITKLSSICTLCGADASRTQRLVNNKPAAHDEPVIHIGSQEAYQARCRSCYHMNITPNCYAMLQQQ